MSISVTTGQGKKITRACACLLTSLYLLFGPPGVHIFHSIVHTHLAHTPCLEGHALQPEDDQVFGESLVANLSNPCTMCGLVHHGEQLFPPLVNRRLVMHKVVFVAYHILSFPIVSAIVLSSRAPPLV